jgi:predicted nucleic acid-binding protein
MPDRRRIVVVNTTPIISLALIGKLSILQHLYEEVLVPSAVESEITAGGTDRTGVVDYQAAGYIRCRPLGDPTRADLLSDLDRGEAEVIA